jgi:N-methylhydantoinase A
VLREVFRQMHGRARERAEANGVQGRLLFTLTAEMRYVGQAFEVPVLFAELELQNLNAADVHKRFADAHQRVYFFGGEATKPIEFVSFRLGVTAPLEKLPLLAQSKLAAAPPRPIQVFDGKAWRDANLLGRQALARDQRLSGPALIEDPTSTLYLPAGWTARSDANDNTILERQ